MTVFHVTWPLLSRKKLGELYKGHYEDYTEHLMDSCLDAVGVRLQLAGLVEVTGIQSCLVN